MKGNVFLSVFSGILFAVICYICCDAFPTFSNHLEISAFSGVLFALLLFPCLLLIRKREERKYAEIEKQISSPVFYKTNGNFDLGQKVRNGNIYFCEAGIVLVSLDTSPSIVEKLPISDIERYTFESVRLTIQTKDGRMYCISAADIAGIRNALKNNGWIR